MPKLYANPLNKQSLKPKKATLNFLKMYARSLFVLAPSTGPKSLMNLN